MGQFTKDPDAVLDYAWDWTDWLAETETIATHTVTVPAGLTLDSDAAVAGVVTAWLSDGNVTRGTYSVTCRITTSSGRTDDRSITITVAER